MQKIRSRLDEFDVAHQRVFVRADLNVPLNNGQILNDHRLLAILPTLDLLQKKGGTIVLATHLGRPKGKMPELSTKILVPWFKSKGYEIHFEPDVTKATAASRTLSKGILLLENLRFFPGEQQHDAAFAQLLFQLGDFYVNDAFALLHRDDTSITLLPRLFSKDKKTFGLLVEQEFTALDRLRENPQKPFVVVCGGGKVADKLPLIRSLLGHATSFLLCPALAFTFLKAQGISVGISLVDENALDEVRAIVNDAQRKGIQLIFPRDYQVALDSPQGTLVEVDAHSIPKNGIGMSIGPKTKTSFAQEIKKAQTVFFNGLPGLWDRPETLEGAHALLTAMAESTAFTVVGGGDSVAAAERYGLTKKMGYCSTGGGATLAYLANEQLPGVEAME